MMGGPARAAQVGWGLVLATLTAAAMAAGLPAEPDTLRFTDITASSGIDFAHHNSPTTQKYLIETMGGGLGLFDSDNDGRLDIFFTNGAQLLDPMPAGQPPVKADSSHSNRLYRGNGDGTFNDVTAGAGLAGSGYAMGVAVGDYDNDGDADLYVTNYGPNQLYRNNGDGTFSDVTQAARVAGAGWSSSAAFVDYDNDGRLDLFVCRYVDFAFADNPYCGERRPGYREYCHPRSFRGATSLLFHNQGDGTFRDVSQESGIGRHVGKALGVAMADYDGDGWIDLFVANDSVPAFLFRNDGRGGFVELALAAGVAVNEMGTAVAGMGADFADYDNDGRPDLVVTTLSGETYSLYRNTGGGFEPATGGSGLAEASFPYSGWGTKLVDFDNDGWKDLFVAQGHVLDTIELTSDHTKYAQPPLLLRGRAGRFTNLVAPAGTARRTWAGRGAAFGDIDNDGDTDIVVSNCGQRPYVLRNDSGGRHWLGLHLVGASSNRDGIGARVSTLTASGLTQHHTVNTASSYQSARDKRLLIGLDLDRESARIEIRWPSGSVQRLTDAPLDRMTVVREPANNASAATRQPSHELGAERRRTGGSNADPGSGVRSAHGFRRRGSRPSEGGRPLDDRGAARHQASLAPGVVAEQ